MLVGCCSRYASLTCSRSLSCRQQPPRDCQHCAPLPRRRSLLSLPRRQQQQPPVTPLSVRALLTVPVTPLHRPGLHQPTKYTPYRPPMPRTHKPRRRTTLPAELYVSSFRFTSVTVVRLQISNCASSATEVFGLYNAH